MGATWWCDKSSLPQFLPMTWFDPHRGHGVDVVAGAEEQVLSAGQGGGAWLGKCCCVTFMQTHLPAC